MKRKVKDHMLVFDGTNFYMKEIEYEETAYILNDQWIINLRNNQSQPERLNPETPEKGEVIV
jgi:hypothetical protein